MIFVCLKNIIKKEIKYIKNYITKKINTEVVFFIKINFNFININLFYKIKEILKKTNDKNFIITNELNILLIKFLEVKNDVNYKNNIILNSQSHICKAIISRGKNKNKICGAKIRNPCDNYCSKHIKKL